MGVRVKLTNRKRAAAATDSTTTTTTTKMEVDSDFDLQPSPIQLQQFASTLSRCTSDPDLCSSFEQLRSQHPGQFVELCKVHLSFLIDVPADFLEKGDNWLMRRSRLQLQQQQQRQQQQHQQQFKRGPAGAVTRWLGLCEQKYSCNASAAAASNEQQQHRQDGNDDDDDDDDCDEDFDFDATPSKYAASGNTQQRGSSKNRSKSKGSSSSSSCNWLQSAERLLKLLQSLPTEAGDGFLSEGIFRKSGSAARQRQLRELVASLEGVCNSDGYSAHDVASTLKLCLREQVVLTTQLLGYFQQVARLQSPDASLLEAKRLKGFRLLVQLLPASRRRLLCGLLSLLDRVAAAACTRMTADTLGTVFGPLLFYPTEAAMPEMMRDLPAATTDFNAAAAFLILHYRTLFQLPASVCTDAKENLNRISSSCRLHHHHHQQQQQQQQHQHQQQSCMPAIDPELSVSVRFADAASKESLDTREFTRRQVASLFAAVQEMPDSAKKRLLVRKFNRTNGGLTAMQQGFTITQHQVDCTYATPARSSSNSSSSNSSSNSSSSSSSRLMKHRCSSKSTGELFASISSPLIGRGRIDFAAYSLSPRKQLVQ